MVFQSPRLHDRVQVTEHPATFPQLYFIFHSSVHFPSRRALTCVTHSFTFLVLKYFTHLSASQPLSSFCKKLVGVINYAHLVFNPTSLKYPFILIVTWVETVNETQGWRMCIWPHGLLFPPSVQVAESTGLAQASRKEAVVDLPAVTAWSFLWSMCCSFGFHI